MVPGMALTPININALRPKDKPYKVTDGGGLVFPSI
jgi:hypothetical protein